MAHEIHRRTPEECMRVVEAEQDALTPKGHLKIFLGYASGVGKTFRMFDEARRRCERGQNIVVGAVRREINRPIHDVQGHGAGPQAAHLEDAVEPDRGSCLDRCAVKVRRQNTHRREQTILQAFLSTVEFWDAWYPNLHGALERPRIQTEHFFGSFWPHTTGLNKLNVEASVSEAVYKELQARGHDVKRLRQFGMSGCATAVLIDPASGNRIAAGDPRRDCYAMAY